MQLGIKTRILNTLRIPFKFKPFESLLRRLVSDKPPDSFLGKLVPNNYQYPKNSNRKFKFHGVNMEADIHDYMGHALYYNFKDPGHDSLFNLVKKSQVILDIGTNIGSTMLRFLDRVGKNGFVFGFEPDPTNYNLAKRNLELNSFENFELFNIGLGDKKGSLSLVTPVESNRGGNRISLNAKGDNSIDVKIDVLDDIEIKAGKIDLIKIDVEGFELRVLNGSKKLIDKFKPVFFIELDDNNLKEVGDSAFALIKFLEDLGYTISHSLNGELISNNYDFTNCHFDIIAKPTGH